VGRRDAQIDVMIAPLIRKLWKLNIGTTNSCQENKPGIIWIQFSNPYSCARFLNMVAPLPNKKDLKNRNFFDTMYCRMTRGGFGEWEYKVHVANFGEDYGIADFDFLVSLRFPQTDLPAVMKALENEERIAEVLGRYEYED
jgi:hypothetical protein